MTSAFDKASSAQHNWHLSDDAQNLAAHTLMDAAADRVTAGYLALLQGVLGWRNGAGAALDLGAGAGHMTRAFRRAGIDMTAAEHSEQGIDLLRRHNPDMPVRQVDMVQFSEVAGYRLILAREVYPVTRVNAFTEQHAMMGRLIDSLVSGGVLLVTGSDTCKPHCMDYAGMVRAFGADARVGRAVGPLIEPLISKAPALMRSPLTCAMAHIAIAPLVAWKRHKGWPATQVIAFVRA